MAVGCLTKQNKTNQTQKTMGVGILADMKMPYNDKIAESFISIKEIMTVFWIVLESDCLQRINYN